MSTIDFSPLFRSSIGFDRLAQALNQTAQLETPSNGYPPYNIETTDDNSYRITMAVAGFSEDELNIESKQDQLVITGTKAPEPDKKSFVHQGIAARNFERRFRMADFVKPTGAKLENGLLHIDLQREIPEALKPRQIQINGNGAKQVEQKAA